MKYPKKCRDLGIFTLTCTIGDRMISHAMLDLGDSLNAMPFNAY